MDKQPLPKTAMMSMRSVAKDCQKRVDSGEYTPLDQLYADNIPRLLDEVARLHTWKGLLWILNEHYPADVFDGSSGDPGPTIVALTREVERHRREILAAGNSDFDWSVLGRLDRLEEAEEEVERLKAGNAHLRGMVRDLYGVMVADVGCFLPKERREEIIDELARRTGAEGA